MENIINKSFDLLNSIITWGKNKKMKNNLLDVIITSSPIPSHPSTHHIDRTIDSLKKINLPSDTKIILSHDGHSDDKYSKNYLKYLETIKQKYTQNKNFYINNLNKRKHLSGNIRSAFELVTPKYVLILQHDLLFIRSFDVKKIMMDMDENKEIKQL